MASITKQPNGRKTIQFTGADKKRRSIRLGKASMKQAQSAKVRIENLVAARLSGSMPDDGTIRWVTALDVAMATRLAKAGLIPEPSRIRLKAFLKAYVASRCDVKPGTITNWGHTQRNLIEFFGPERLLREITVGDAKEWRLHLIRQGLADNTVRKRSSNAKQFFQAARDKKLIPENPFAGLRSTVVANRERDYFITRDEAQAVLDACPDAEWRLLFSLSRYGGLRCPSEHLALRLDDVNWHTNRIRVTSPKTEHHEGGEFRLMPLFPELRPYLLEVSEKAEVGQEFFITRYRRTNANLRTQLLRIIGRAGVEPWPKLFQNLRATRQTELENEHPSHVVCAWIGNSRVVAAKHYLQVTDEHFSRAVGGAESGAPKAQSGSNVVQNPV